jgi:uncharacterized protein YdeI (YjbR/CyaY-like superfamily)
MKKLYFKARDEWREWLSQNHNNESALWLIFYRKGSGKATLDYEESVEEALCFGWIDSIIKNLDHESYLRKFTPRKPDSKWSNLNKKRVQKMIEQGLMTPVGQSSIDTAMESGVWYKADRLQIGPGIPVELQNALKGNIKAKKFFEQLAPSYQKQYIGWIQTARRPETRQRRVEESLALLERGEKLGLK